MTAAPRGPMTAEELERALAALRESAGLPTVAPPPPAGPEPVDVRAALRGLRPRPDDAEQRERERVASEQAAAREAWRKRVAAERAGLERRPGARRMIEAVRAQHTPCALLIGPTGCGKTTAALWLRAGFGGEWSHAWELAACTRWHSLGDGLAPAVLRACTSRVLYLDDLGAEDARDIGVLQYVIDKRYFAHAPTVTTTGLMREQLTERYGAPTVRKLTDQHVIRRDGSRWPMLVVDAHHV